MDLILINLRLPRASRVDEWRKEIHNRGRRRHAFLASILQQPKDGIPAEGRERWSNVMLKKPDGREDPFAFPL